MSLCQTHIVECLRNDGIFPSASSKSFYSDNYLPSNALVYDTANYFNSADNSDNEWWIVDFKVNVLIENYSIMAGSGGGFIYNWDSEISTNNQTWVKVDEKRNTICSDQIFTLGEPVTCRYFKITGRGNSINNSPKIAYYYVKFYGSINPPTPSPFFQVISPINNCISDRSIYFLFYLIIMYICL